MFSQPKNCCCCFGLRTGSLILATLDLFGYVVLLVQTLFALVHDQTWKQWVAIPVYGALGLLSGWFLLGVSKVTLVASKLTVRPSTSRSIDSRYSSSPSWCISHWN